MFENLAIGYKWWIGTERSVSAEIPMRLVQSYPITISICLERGKLYKAYDKLGAQVCRHQGVQGVSFAVWAPNAKRVSVVGDFNGWDGRRHPMQSRGGCGIWELFIPDLQEGEVYKYEILSPEWRSTLLESRSVCHGSRASAKDGFRYSNNESLSMERSRVDVWKEANEIR